MNREHPFDKLELTSFVTGDVSAAKEALIKEHLEVCEECRIFVNTLQEEQESFLASMPFNEGMFDESSTEIIVEDTAPLKGKENTTFFTFPKIAAVAALLLFATIITFTIPDSIPTNETKEHTVTLKGEEEFFLYALESNGEIVQRDDDIYHPGDRVQICYTSTNKEYLMLFAFDSSGVISRYFPAYGDSSINVETGSGIPLPNSIRLDGYLGKERYLLVLSKKALSATAFEQDIKKAFHKHGFDKFKLPKRAGQSVIEKVTLKRMANES